jgi:hypothetical protein
MASIRVFHPALLGAHPVAPPAPSLIKTFTPSHAKFAATTTTADHYPSRGH